MRLSRLLNVASWDVGHNELGLISTVVLNLNMGQTAS